MRLSKQTKIFLTQKSIPTPKPVHQAHLPIRPIHTAPTSGHGMLSPPHHLHPHPHPHAPKLPKDSYMYETFAAVIAGTCSFLGYLLLTEEKWESERAKKARGKALSRRRWAGIVDGEPELEELCDEIMEID